MLHLLTLPRCQVAASRPVAFYASLAKKLLLDNATVELSAIGEFVVTILVFCQSFYSKQYSIMTLMYLQARP